MCIRVCTGILGLLRILSIRVTSDDDDDDDDRTAMRPVRRARSDQTRPTAGLAGTSWGRGEIIILCIVPIHHPPVQTAPVILGRLITNQTRVQTSIRYCRYIIIYYIFMCVGILYTRLMYVRLLNFFFFCFPIFSSHISSGVLSVILYPCPRKASCCSRCHNSVAIENVRTAVNYFTKVD